MSSLLHSVGHDLGLNNMVRIVAFWHLPTSLSWDELPVAVYVEHRVLAFQRILAICRARLFESSCVQTLYALCGGWALSGGCELSGGRELSGGWELSGGRELSDSWELVGGRALSGGAAPFESCLVGVEWYRACDDIDDDHREEKIKGEKRPAHSIGYSVVRGKYEDGTSPGNRGRKT